MQKLLAASSELVEAVESMDTVAKVQSDPYFICSMGDDLSNCEKTLSKLRLLAWDKVAPFIIDEKGYEDDYNPLIKDNA